MYEAFARFNISNEFVIGHWVKVYKDTNIKLGRSKDMAKPQKTPPLRANADQLRIS